MLVQAVRGHVIQSRGDGFVQLRRGDVLAHLARANAEAVVEALREVSTVRGSFIATRSWGWA